MYGLVNKSLAELVSANYGDETWQEICARAGLSDDIFIISDAYPDEITFALVGAASEVLDTPAAELLVAFGRHWVLDTATLNYADLLDDGGESLEEFLHNLPNFHSRIQLIYPHLKPPRFHTEEIGEHAINLHYMSDRQGLTEFVRGLLEGLGERFRVAIDIDHHTSVTDGADHDEFKVSWGAEA